MNGNLKGWPFGPLGGSVPDGIEDGPGPAHPG